MERKLTKRKIRPKFKRYAAAVAGAAILAGAGAGLPGVPVARAMAADHSLTAVQTSDGSYTTEKSNSSDKSERHRYDDRDQHSDRDRHGDRDQYNDRGWHEHNNSWPSSGDNRGWYENGRIHYLNDNSSNDYSSYGNVHYLSNPVDFVKHYAAQYNFDRYRDSFTILSQSSTTATVQVRKQDTGQQFRVDLESNNNGNWIVVAVRGIGDSNFSATYSPG
jgi:hypothetical protein